MQDSIKLFDLEKFEQPEHRCSFRTVQVFKCPVCEALTNKAEIEGVFPPGARGRVVYCPHASECWHHEIEEKIRKYKNARSLRKKKLKEEIEMQKGNVANDIIGNVSNLTPWGFVSVTETFREPFCEHFRKTELGKFIR